MFVLLVLSFRKRERKNTEIFSYFLAKMCFYNFSSSFFYTHTTRPTKHVYLFIDMAHKMNNCVISLMQFYFPSSRKLF